MKTISLTQSQVALVAGDDHEWLSLVKWFAHWATNTRSFYATRQVRTGLDHPKQRYLQMHNAIWEHHNEPIPDGFTVDHINRNTLDNCLSNLRLATPSQQKQNQGLQRSNTSGYLGVTWHKSSGKWQARIGVDGKSVYLGLSDDRIEAALAHDAAARIHHDPAFAQLNFPDHPEVYK